MTTAREKDGAVLRAGGVEREELFDGLVTDLVRARGLIR